jgi:DNA-binding NtrC family response regulator
MSQREKEAGRFQEAESLAALPAPAGAASHVQARQMKPRSTWADAGSAESLEKIKESLVLAYLGANQNFKNIPLKAFLDGFEKKILLACLRLTNGSQKSAAAMLSLKPTALFEKMRKHGIRSCRGKLSGDTWEPHPRRARLSLLPEPAGRSKHAAGIQL